MILLSVDTIEDGPRLGVLELDPGAQHFQEGRYPCRMTRPGRRGDEIPVYDGFGGSYIHVLSAGSRYFRTYGGIGGQPPAHYDVGRGEYLDTVANGCDRFGKV